MLFSILVKIATFDVIPVDPVMNKLDELIPTASKDSNEMADNF